jgi:hypothetical protein
MSDEAERFATRAWVVCGTVLGALVGLFIAPRLQRSLDGLGVDPFALGPALVIISVAAATGGVLAWRGMRR